MKTKPPETRRRFSHAWDEISYLHEQMLYWLFERNDRVRAARFSNRLGALLAENDPTCDAVLGAACRALIAEAAGDYWTAIRARERELELIDLLSRTDAPKEAKYPADEVSDRMDLLAGMYWAAGDLDKAEKTLLDSQRLCAEQGIQFDGKSMLQELRKEKQESAGTKAVPKKRAS